MTFQANELCWYFISKEELRECHWFERNWVHFFTLSSHFFFLREILRSKNHLSCYHLYLKNQRIFFCLRHQQQDFLCSDPKMTIWFHLHCFEDFFIEMTWLLLALACLRLTKGHQQDRSARKEKSLHLVQVNFYTKYDRLRSSLVSWLFH